MTQDFDDAPGQGSGGGAQDTGSRSGPADGQGGSQDNQQGEGGSRRKRSRGSRGRGRRRKKPGEAQAQPGNQPSNQPSNQADAQPAGQRQQQPRQAARRDGQRDDRRDRRRPERDGRPDREDRPQPGNRAEHLSDRQDRGARGARPARGDRRPRGDRQPGLPSLEQPAILDPLRELSEEELEAADRAALAKANALADAGIVPSVAAALGQTAPAPRKGQKQGRQPGNQAGNQAPREGGQRQPRQGRQQAQQPNQKERRPEQPRPEHRAEHRPEPKPEARPEARSEARSEGRPEEKREPRPEAKAPQHHDAPEKQADKAPDKAQHTSRADAEIVETSGKKGKQKMFIGVLPGELVEVVLTEEGAVQEYYVEMLHQAKTKGNIYKGYIHNIDAALQAAFINYGAERNGFLQIDEVHPEYYQGSYPLKKGARFPLIQKVLKPGQEVLIQVVKEPTGKKGAFVSSYLSLPGRYFVYTLGRDQQGVSRKIEDEKERERLKSCIDQISPPEGVGLIVRTAGIGRAKTELVRDYKYLHRLWTDIKKKAQTEKAPALVYKELDLAVRAARDYLNQDVSEVWVDDPETFEQIKQYVALAFPKRPDMVKLHADHDKTLWERFGLTRQVEQIYSREVTLPSGGRLVFDHTEALTSVDINSGKIGGEQSFAKMAHKTNMEAAAEIARQLKLRDIGGQIVIDFIEMKDPKHLREVEKVMRQALKYDRARTDVSTISPFGLMELVRQRLGSSAISVSTEPCPCCGGTGIRRNLEWQALQTMKTIHRLLRRPGCPNPLQVPLGQELAIYMLNNKRELLTEMGAKMDTKVEIIVDIKQP